MVNININYGPRRKRRQRRARPAFRSFKSTRSQGDSGDTFYGGYLPPKSGIAPGWGWNVKHGYYKLPTPMKPLGFAFGGGASFQGGFMTTYGHIF